MYVDSIVDLIQKQQGAGIKIHIQWLPTDSDKKGAQLAKDAGSIGMQLEKTGHSIYLTGLSHI
jgi:hypothetical protein